MENKPLQQRKLAAILFADIVGYTALMQSNEQQALSHLQKFKAALEQLVPSNKGEIIQFYGDGCLATFHSSLDAVACAKKLQTQFQGQQKVPVRIGVHSGDVVFKEGNVFGDAVNITSRIEAMGVPGAVLLSSRVRNHIKNKPGFQLTELGAFQFKNVVEPMSIFALQGEGLVVPELKQIAAKKSVQPSDNTAKKYLYPAAVISLLLAIIYLLFTNYIHNAQEHSQQVVTTKVDGSKETRMIPTAEFTRKLVSFPLKNELGEVSLDWLSVGIPMLFTEDIEQDYRLFASNPSSLKDEYDHYLQTFPNAIPVSTELKIAQDFFTDYFVTGTIEKGEATNYKVTLQVYETNSGKIFQELKEEGDDILNIVDNLSTAFKENQFLPDASNARQTAIDLPTNSLVSNNLEALKNYVEGTTLIIEDVQNFQPAFEKLKKATELDPNCSDCFRMLAQWYFGAGMIEEAKVAADKSALLAESLPERKQLAAREMQLNINQDIGGRVRLLENWRKLYPDDLTPYRRLLSIYPAQLEYDKAKAVGQVALERGHRGDILTDLASIYIQTEDFDKAEELLQEFAAIYPNKANKTTELADIYIAKGKQEKALEFYENLNLVGVAQSINMVGLSKVQSSLGRMEEAEQTLVNFLKQARLPEDSINIYSQLENLYVLLGKFQDFRNAYEKRGDIVARTLPPLARFNVIFSRVQDHLKFGKEDIVEKQLAEAKDLSPEINSLVSCLGSLFINFAKEDAEALESLMADPTCKAVIIQRANAQILVDAEIARYRKDYGEAAKQFELYLEKSGSTGQEFEDELIEVYRLNKDFDKANSLSQKLLLSNPYSPVVLTESAKLKADQGDKSGAKILLDKALAVWSEADKNFKYYQEALAFEQELSGN